MRKFTKVSGYTMNGKVPHEIVTVFIAVEKLGEDWSLELFSADDEMLHIPFNQVIELVDKINEESLVGGV